MVVVFGNIMAFGEHSTPEKNNRYKIFMKNYQNDEFLQSFLTIKVINGEMIFQFYRVRNHYGDYIERIISFFEEDIPNMLGELAFGFIYIYDDEGRLSDNEAVVYTLKKGIVKQEPDYYFSPFSEKVSPEGIAQF